MALNSFIRDFGWANVSKSTRDGIQANIVSTFQAGCFFGALLTFTIAEKIGRKRTVMIAGLVFLVGAALQTAARGSLNLIYAGRAIAGLGIGASSLTVPVYIAEVAPPSIRGRLVGIFEIASQGGGMLGQSHPPSIEISPTDEHKASGSTTPQTGLSTSKTKHNGSYL